MEKNRMAFYMGSSEKVCVMRAHLGRSRRQRGAQPEDLQRLTAKDRNWGGLAHLSWPRYPGHLGRLAEAPATNPAVCGGALAAATSYASMHLGTTG